MALTKIKKLETASILDDAVTNAKIADDAIDSPQIADGAVDTVNIADLNVDTGKITGDAITTAKINDGAVTAAKIGSEAVTNAKIQTNAVDDRALASNSVVTGVINNGAVTAAKIGDEQVTLAKLPHGTSSNDGKFLRANNGADPSFETVPAGGQAYNYIHNGAMTVAQRGDAHQNVGNSASTYTLDRWKLYVQNSSARFQVERNYDHSLPDGFKNSMRISCTTTDTSLAATDEVNLQQSIEGQDLTAFAKGTGAAKQYTLSFYARSTKTGTYCVTLLGRDNTTSTVSKSYTMTSSWTRHVLTFPADTNGNRKDNSDNGEALRIMWWLAAGSGVNNGTLQETWTNSTDTGRATGQVNFADSTNEFYITGVQLEVGATASDFAYESYAETVRKCQRYYWKIALNTFRRVNGYKRADSNCYWELQCPVPMRTNPSPTLLTSGTFTNFNSNFNTTQSGAHVNEWNQSTGWGLLYLSSNWSSTSAPIPSWEGYSIEFSSDL